MTNSDPRPRVVTAAFWLWVVSAVLLMAYGMFVVTVELAGNTTLLRISGFILIVAGAALGYVGGRGGRGDPRFMRAAVALSMALVVFLSVLLAIQLLGFLVGIIVVCLIVASGLVTRSADAAAWYASNDVKDPDGV